MMISRKPITKISHQPSPMKLRKQPSKDDFQIELQSKKPIELQNASAFMTNTSAIDDSTIASSDEMRQAAFCDTAEQHMMFSEGQPDIASCTVEEE